MKRFYRDVAVEATDGGFRILLDGPAIKTQAIKTQAIKTQGGRAQIVPTRALATAMAAEWAEQGETIDPARFVFRDMADYAIDVVAPDPAATIAALVGYAGTDTLCYRAFPDEPIAPRQHAQWEPLVEDAEARFSVRFVRVAGVMPRPQPTETIATLAAHLGTVGRRSGMRRGNCRSKTPRHFFPSALSASPGPCPARSGPRRSPRLPRTSAAIMRSRSPHCETSPALPRR
jgi:chaperone required for assembly of F1-ATPase